MRLKTCLCLLIEFRKTRIRDIIAILNFLKTNIMKKLLLIAFFISAHINALENNLLETKIVKQWMDYSKAFEYKDYNRIANHFTYPAVFNLATPIVVNDKKMMVDRYKSARENIQKGYKYSLLEKWILLNITEDLIILDAHYSRFNTKYESIHTGRGLYTYKNIKGNWLMTEVTTLK